MNRSLVALGFVVFLAGCATVPNPNLVDDGARYLPDSEQLYLYMDGVAAKKLMTLESQDRVEDLLQSVESIYASVGGNFTLGVPIFVIAARGDFPKGAVELWATFQKDWKRNPGPPVWWHSDTSQLQLLFIGKSLLFVSNGRMDRVVARLRQGESINSAAPLQDLHLQYDIAIYVPNISDVLPLINAPQLDTLPAESAIVGLLSDNSGYKSDVQITFGSEREARISLVVFRLLFARLKKTEPNRVDSSAGVEVDGAVLLLKGLRFSQEEVSGIFQQSLIGE